MREPSEPMVKVSDGGTGRAMSGVDSQMVLTPYSDELVLTVSQERRLRVATQILAGLAAGDWYPEYTGGDIGHYVDKAYSLADLMIAEAAKE